MIPTSVVVLKNELQNLYEIHSSNDLSTNEKKIYNKDNIQQKARSQLPERSAATEGISLPRKVHSHTP